MSLTVQSKTAFSGPPSEANVRQLEGKKFLEILANQKHQGVSNSVNGPSTEAFVTLPPDTSESSPSLTMSTKSSIAVRPSNTASSSEQVKEGNASVSNSATHPTELRLKFMNFPTTVTTNVVWDVFSKEGTVVSIDLFEFNGRPDGNGFVRFR